MIGFKGERGYSAYEIAVQNGFVGSEQSWLAQLGTSSAYGQNATTITTTTENQTELVLPDEYNSNSILTIYIDGLKLNESMYSIDVVNKKIKLTNPIENIGTKVEISITTMTATNLPIVTEVNYSSTDETAPSSKCVYDIEKGLEAKIEESNLPAGGTKGQVLIKASDEDNDVEWQDVFKKIYPVGSIYMTIDKTNPSELFGGTWVAWGEGRVPVGIDTEDESFDDVEKTGGEKRHTLTIAEMPSHNHSLTNNTLVNRNATGSNGSQGTTTVHGATIECLNTGGGEAHNILQPYIVCCMWKRTA